MSENEKKTTQRDFSRMIDEAVKEVVYISEIDSSVKEFSGDKIEELTKKEFLAQINLKAGSKVQEKDFESFFAPLIKIRKWFGEDERKMSENFVWLKELLQQNLVQKKVFVIGKKNIDIYVVGLDKENIVRGIQTKAVET